ncbi:hypothetical protein OSB04_001796 [Centaurea solstitialis]|uniref:SWIM-type domain-containing protein n=1 Tax=Centaurea solstitialis TaxID=347529 RepID=A0AA38TRP4_9ASTR|nr:hypothetical protein OSB04_001796 [Centaurea solstitialis]
MGCTIKEINIDAWEYLKEIGVSNWTLLHDKRNRRWGNLTTNIAESFNNVLRGARVLPIMALIDFTFNKAVQHFRKHMEIASNCPTALPPRMWEQFNKRDRYAQGHTITEFDYTNSVYRVVSRMQNDYTVNYGKRTCTCGKWQIHRFPCSHGIAVCRKRGEDPHTLVQKWYTTKAYKRQYKSDFMPLAHVDYWNDPGWRIKANASKLSPSMGRRRTRRIRNEMDVRDPNEPIIRRCGLCKQPGHNRTTCQNSHP